MWEVLRTFLFWFTSRNFALNKIVRAATLICIHSMCAGVSSANSILSYHREFNANRNYYLR